MVTRGVLFCLILALVSVDLLAFVSPWNRKTTYSTPWGRSSERKEKRESFFKDLNFFRFKSPSIEPAKRSTKSGVDNSEMSRLPWARYREKFPQDVFSRQLLWPVRQGRLTSGYGIRKGRYHEGLDIAAHPNAPIRAISKGRVVFNGTIKGYGKTVVIYHGNGIASVYAHNSVNLVRKGASVQRADLIAEVGNTGKSRGHHVHFELRKNGKPINPLLYTYMQSPMLASK